MNADHLLALNAAEGLLQIVIARVEPPTASAAASLPAPQPLVATRLCALEWLAPSQGAELLAPVLQDACVRLGITARDIGRIACVRGPGSFTGLRLTFATAAGLARATGALQAGMEYLPLLAQNALRAYQTLDCKPESNSVSEHFEGTVFQVLTHARRNLIHMQGFSARALPRLKSVTSPVPDIIPTSDILVLTLPEAAACISGDSRQSILLGSGITRNREFWDTAQGSLGPHVCLLPPAFDRPDPDILLHAAVSLDYSSADITPQYVRPCDAEDNLNHIAGLLGIDADDARVALRRLTARERGN